ncbi:ABC transporter ATP-binding protein [Pseudooceanicola sediminis]|uniref:ABC transporter ATP-binding protein n=1 Tax=Pseudooceanicola sediminis TaxID=2211117 RepID=A0A399IXS0_9RHOB|nr:ABC transporter ATP-binding protein [Pseudooceanicola sediminis]RII37905.1 ABC transporter ATP-binding protein [Pseudooceanicola sediminis]|tara:strand:+ start:9445 stop:11439 length:1995 start_codon:yes stop_codon:yes gene_type:complete
MTIGPELLRINDLSIAFPLMQGRLQAVKSASLRVLPGKVTALVGESGSGKSVISQAIMGLQPAFADVRGQVLFADPGASKASAAPVDLLKLPRDGRQLRAIRGSRIGMIFQEPMTSFSLLHTVGNQISEALRVHTTLSPAARREECEEMLGLVGFSDPRRVFDMYPFELSGGMRQRAMIAMALICRPALLIADEPTTALDVTIQAQILKLLRDLQEKMDMAILLITHDLGVVANIADEVVVIYQGEIMESGPVGPIFRAPKHPYLKGLMAAVPHFDMPKGERLKPLREIVVDHQTLLGGLTAPVAETAVAAEPVAASAQAAAVRPADVTAPREKAGGFPEVLLSVRNLRKTFQTRKQDWKVGRAAPQRPAVDNVSFDIRRGECLGLVGESGCGKTTVSKILMRAVTPDSGSVVFDDGAGPIDVLAARGDDLQALRTRVQMVFQDPVSSLSPRMSVGSILSEPFDIHKRGTRAARKDAVSALLKVIGLDPSAARRYPHSFSGGQRQRIGIARALALAPSLIVCDEPVSALDVSVQAQILNLLKDLQKDLGLTYLFISHNLAVVDYMADRVAVMWAGKIVEIAPREVIMRSPAHPYTRSLLEAVPYPDLDRPLNFARAGESSTASSAGWAPAFRDDGGGRDLAPLDLGGGHFVLARKSADLSEVQP